MAFNSILRKSGSFARVLAVAGQLTKNNHPGHRALLFTAINQHQHKDSFVPRFHFSSVASKKKPTSDENLLRVIESEIECAKDTDDHNAVEEVPSNFPFKIIDSPGQQTITLERTYQGEEIKVEVHMPDLVTGEENDDDNDNEGERASQSSIPLAVSVYKKGGPYLEFNCVGYPDEIVIDSLSVKNPDLAEDQIAYEGPDFQDLDENLQKSFHKYLEIRGIKPSTTNFLHEYMINKDSKEYLVWLTKLKSFVQA
ncbi:mitochondrial protein [Spatholobus suberectus]|nr:mitochondrial protein [Spatholobus suberectus]